MRHPAGSGVAERLRMVTFVDGGVNWSWTLHGAVSATRGLARVSQSTCRERALGKVGFCLSLPQKELAFEACPRTFGQPDI